MIKTCPNSSILPSSKAGIQTQVRLVWNKHTSGLVLSNQRECLIFMLVLSIAKHQPKIFKNKGQGLSLSPRFHCICKLVNRMDIQNQNEQWMAGSPCGQSLRNLNTNSLSSKIIAWIIDLTLHFPLPWKVDN